MKVLRTMLFTPGNNWRMIQKDATLDADAIILDLEDAVPIAEKETARVFVKDAIRMIKSRGSDVFVRINALTTELSAQDLKIVIQEGLDGIIIPKIESKEDIIKVEKLIEESEKEVGLRHGIIGLIPIIETAKGVINAYEIDDSSKRIIASSFGALDFTRDMGTTMSREGTELIYARSHIVISAKAAGIQAIDTPWMDLTDRKGLIEDSKLARQLGYKGKFLIHPDQIEPVNKIFSPSEEEMKYAEEVIEAFKKDEIMGVGATSFNGKMIDAASCRQAEELLLLVEAIANKETLRKNR